MTPMMLQYLEIKDKYRDAILFYRLGDFYEMFFDDAKVASRELELALTGRSCGEDERAPMCGVPYHAADSYIGRLVSKGYKVVVCEQMEDPSTAKGLVRRDIVRIVTPGTMIDSAQLDSTKNNFLTSIFVGDELISVCFADISTGEITVARYSGDGREDALLNEISAFDPKEALINVPLASLPRVNTYLRDHLNAFVTENRAGYYELAPSLSLFENQFGKSAASDTLERCPALVQVVGAMLAYIVETQKTNVNNIRSISFQDGEQYMELDTSTRRNLELCESMRTREKRGTLLWVLDSTGTSAGARLLRRWVEQPLINAAEITRRQNAVGELAEAAQARVEIAGNLRHILDLDRLMTKLVYGTANAKDLKAISQTAAVLPEIKKLTADFSSAELAEIHEKLDTLSDIRELIERSITDDPPFSLREGGFIKPGYNSTVDELSSIVHDAKSYIAEIAEREREKTGIKNLKIAYNRVFGYYIEVTKSNLADVPDNYIRKQILTGGERFITEELKEKESMILGASDKLTALEYKLFTEIRDSISSQLRRVQESAFLIAKLDCYVSLADVAVKNEYVCPEIDYSDVISIKEGRHPVVERFSKGGYFVPNDTLLDTSNNRMMIITGPNMAGKSTYMRQVALIAVMAQIGSFVPAAEARIGITDRIFTRVGASDDLASGTSTFMLEMNEVSYILGNATRRSLVIYDEIGRGTSTFDGMSIARAVAEYTANKISCKTMFATHYHELTSLENEISGVVNYNIAAKKKGEDIIFLRKIVRGGTDDSYGIEVARLAGVPKEVVRRAREILRLLESGKEVGKTKIKENNNISIDDLKADEVRRRLVGTDVNLLTPIEALTLLAELKKIAD